MEQSVCDSIFMVFDADRSGSIDIDEFGAYVMNADFKPHFSKPKMKIHKHEIKPAISDEVHFVHDIHHDGTVQNFHSLVVGEKEDNFHRHLGGHVEDIKDNKKIILKPLSVKNKLTTPITPSPFQVPGNLFG